MISSGSFRYGGLQGVRDCKATQFYLPTAMLLRALGLRYSHEAMSHSTVPQHDLKTPITDLFFTCTYTML